MRPKPSRVSAFRNCFGTIWSVSTLTRSSGATMPVWVEKGCMRLVSDHFKRCDLFQLRPKCRAALVALRSARGNDIVNDATAILVLIALAHHENHNIRDFAIFKSDVELFVLIIASKLLRHEPATPRGQRRIRERQRSGRRWRRQRP